MIRHTILTLAALIAFNLNAFALEVKTRTVSPPPAGTSNEEIPAFYSPNGVRDLRVASNMTRTHRGGTMTATVWRWTDRRGTSFVLTRRLVTIPGGPIGSLGEFTLETTSAPRPMPMPIPTPTPRPMPMPIPMPTPRPMPMPMPTPGKMLLPPAHLSTMEIPAFYSPNGVNHLLISSSIGTDELGRERVETTWKWSDNRGVNYTLNRIKAGFSTSYRLSKMG